MSEIFHAEFEKAGKKAGMQIWRIEVQITRSILAIFLKLCIPCQARREGGRRGHCLGARGHREARGSELSGLECKIHQLKLRPVDSMMLFLISGRNLNICERYDLILLITRC